MKKNDYDTEDFPEVEKAFKILEKELKEEEKARKAPTTPSRRPSGCL